MYKTDFVEEMLEKMPDDIDSKAHANRVIDGVLDLIKEAVADGETVTFLGFGTFKKAERAPRKYHDFTTGETKETKKTVVPVFKPSEGFKNAVKPKRGRPKKK